MYECRDVRNWRRRITPDSGLAVNDIALAFPPTGAVMDRTGLLHVMRISSDGEMKLFGWLRFTPVAHVDVRCASVDEYTSAGAVFRLPL